MLYIFLIAYFLHLSPYIISCTLSFFLNWFWISYHIYKGPLWLKIITKFTYVSYDIYLGFLQCAFTNFEVFLEGFFFQMAIQLPQLIVKKSICSLLTWKNPADHIIPYVYLSLICNVYSVYWYTQFKLLKAPICVACLSSWSYWFPDSFPELSWILLLILSYKLWNKTFELWK